MSNLKSRNAKRKCIAKRKYRTAYEAQQVADRMKDQGMLGCRVYRCNGVRGVQAHWHVTGGN